MTLRMKLLLYGSGFLISALLIVFWFQTLSTDREPAFVFVNEAEVFSGDAESMAEETQRYLQQASEAKTLASAQYYIRKALEAAKVTRDAASSANAAAGNAQFELEQELL